jgi:predicted S18 family serine protease
MPKILEKQIHDELENIIKSDSLNQKIKNKSEIDKIIQSLDNDQFIPAFSLDYLARKKLLKCAEYILPKLNGLELSPVRAYETQ